MVSFTYCSLFLFSFIFLLLKNVKNHSLLKGCMRTVKVQMQPYLEGESNEVRLKL